MAVVWPDGPRPSLAFRACHPTGVLANDHDPDGEHPLTAIRVSDPMHGTLEYFNAGGDFKYVPDPGFTGEDSFQYVANDGLADSPVPASVKIITFKVDLEIADEFALGQFLSVQQEDTRGAFVVGNSNDTDFDEVIDVLDEDGVPGEQDVLTLRVWRPYAGFEGEVTLTFPSYALSLWRDRGKTPGTQIGQDGVARFSSAQFGQDDYLEIYAEATATSEAVRDIRLTLQYRDKTDTVLATAVWAELAQEEDSIRSYSEIMEPPDSPWQDMPTPPRNLLQQHGGTGLRPADPATGLRNVIIFAFQAYPDGIHNEADVQFDITRRKNTWEQVTDVNGEVTSQRRVAWPLLPEEANDDVSAADESHPLNANDRIFSLDAPGEPTTSPEFPSNVLSEFRGNFEEFVRVGIGFTPTGNGWSGSRASPKWPWHDRQYLIVSDGVWIRPHGDYNEVPENEIGLGWIEIP
ncbi:MAG: Ig-like domain-containing protein [Thermoguttaceae bacterium]|jgi:hypothetical protein|nr:Ig-like domain-containing protein [Thermoguttaceae bacterium]